MTSSLTLAGKQENKQFNRKLISMVVPLAVQGFMTAAVSASDALMLGFLSQSALSAVSLASQITFVLNLFITVLVQGTTMIAAQYWGKGNRTAVEMVLGLSMKYVVVITTIFFIGATFFPHSLMRLFTPDPVLIEGGVQYLRIAGFSYVLTGISQIYLCIMKNAGKTAKSTVIGSTAMVLNLGLNVVFIFGAFGIPAMGIRGAATATVIATAIQAVWSLMESRKPDNIHIRPAYLICIDAGLRKDYIKYTLPIVGNYMFWGVGVTMYSVIMGHLGSDAVAAMSIANIVRNLIISVSKGIGTAGGILVGNELGRDEIKRAVRYAKRVTLFSFVSGILSGLLLLLLRPAIIKAAGLGDVASGYLSGMLLICCYYMVALSIDNTVIGGIFCAGGKSKFGLICDGIVLWLVIIPFAALAAFVWHLPVLAVYFIVCLDEVVKLPMVWWYFRRYSWVQNLTRQTVACS